MKRTLMILAAVWLVLGFAFAHDATADEQPIGRATVSVHRGDLNGRLHPTIHSSIEARFANGEIIDIYEVQGSWARAKGGEAGDCWVHTDYLVTAEHGSYTVVSNGSLRIRSAPDGEVTGKIKAGNTVEVLGVFGNWARTENGWVMIANGDETYLERNEQ